MADNFFTLPKITDLMEEHADAVDGLNEKESERILKAYGRVRQQLRDRLDTAGTGTFTAQRARSTLLQVEAALKRMGDDLLSGMQDAAQNMGELSIDQLVTETETWDDYFLGAVSPIDLDAARIVTDSTNLLINQYQASIDAYSSGVRAKIAQGLSDGVIGGQTTGEMMQAIGKTLLGEEWRLRRVVRTELQGVHAKSKLLGMQDMQDDIPDLMKSLYNPKDKRTANDSLYVQDRIDLGDRRLIVKIDEKFSYRWPRGPKGKLREYSAPPDRPNDRSILIPYRKAWSKD